MHAVLDCSALRLDRMENRHAFIGLIVYGCTMIPVTWNIQYVILANQMIGFEDVAPGFPRKLHNG
jgi:hypothetical protein